jgi:hypothetical protein
MQSAPPSRSSSPRDWRIGFGLSVSLAWLGLAALYVTAIVGWRAFVTQPAEAMGGFLEGAFAPLAFLWLVIGFFLQQRELALNTQTMHAQYEEMRRTAESTEVQSRAIAENALHQRRETVIRIAALVDDQLGGIAGLLYLSSQGGDLDGSEIERLWNAHGAGDRHLFSRRFAGLYYPARSRGDGSFYDLFWGTPVRSRHSTTFIETFESVLAMTEGCDDDGVTHRGLTGTGHGTLYQMILEARREGPGDGETPGSV